jgi:hypothetical protein
MEVRCTVRIPSNKLKIQVPARIFELDQRLQDMHDILGPLNVPQSESGSILELSHYQKLLLHAVYHICKIVLHSSVLPIFSNEDEEAATVSSINRTCALEVLSNASIFAELLQAVLDTNPDMTKIYPFVSYAAYTTGSVLKALASVQSGDARLHHAQHFQSCVQIVSGVSKFWPVLRHMRSQMFRGASFLLNQNISTSAGQRFEILDSEVITLATSSKSSLNAKLSGYVEDVSLETLLEATTSENQDDASVALNISQGHEDMSAMDNLGQESTSSSFMGELGIGLDEEIDWLLEMEGGEL